MNDNTWNGLRRPTTFTAEVSISVRTHTARPTSVPLFHTWTRTVPARDVLVVLALFVVFFVAYVIYGPPVVMIVLALLVALFALILMIGFVLLLMR